VSRNKQSFRKDAGTCGTAHKPFTVAGAEILATAGYKLLQRASYP
jgi:hypothetical protein